MDDQGILILARHGQSEGNALNVFTGLRNLPLTDAGRHEARAIARALKAAGYRPDRIFSSALDRAIETAQIIVNTLGGGIPFTSEAALNERDYGDLTGLNKAEAAVRFGDRQVHEWRRSYDTSPPGGESLRDARLRVVPYYEAGIRPHLQKGETVLIIAHGNSLRALMMEVEKMTPAQIVNCELKTGEIIVYRRDERGHAARVADIPVTI